MTTFSQLVDNLTLETRRPDMRADIAVYLLQTLREVHFTPDRGSAITYVQNLTEAQLTATTDDGFSWTPPAVERFQTMMAVRYDSIYVRDETTRWIPEKRPGIGMASAKRYYYRAGNQFFFYGYGGIDARISLAWFEYPRRLKYYPANQPRPATWDDETGWSFDPAFDVDDSTRENALQLTTNWLLQRWQDVISEGVRAKVYKRLSDTERSRTTYSLYGSLRAGLFTSESVMLTGVG